MGARLCREPDRARRNISHAFDGAAVHNCGFAVPVCAAAEGILADPDRDQLHAVSRSVPVGLTSVIVQSQALFTVGFAAALFDERPSRMQTLGIAIAACGLLMICGTVGYDFSVSAFAVLMLSPICFAAGNLLLRRGPGRGG